MAGALMQLVAYGAQDAYLTTDPEVTFFKVVYKRHTNFAMESMEQTLNGTANFNNKVVCKVSRNGDLMSSCYVETTLPAIALSESDNYVGRVGWRLLKQVELRVGGQMIDRQYSTWMHVWTELTHTTDQKALLDKLVGAKGTDGAVVADAAVSATTLNIPLLFSFCRNPGLALPLIALQYHEVEIHIEFETLARCMSDGTTSQSGSLSNTSLWVDYVFLDAEERKEFAANPHEYLIETVQTQEATLSGSSVNSVRLTFNHPTKELIWVCRDSSPTGDVFTDFRAAGTALNSLANGKLKLNGQDRFAQRAANYFNYVQPYQHHTGKPDVGINAYSFALKPEEHQPSGTVNFSRIDNINLDVTPNDGSCTELHVMAHSYNVFRVASGMGGLAYAN
mgnify:FL=1|tara:strand:+ start:88 stop:1266 length:1179 start_codon:yes stop_codon:yes gene_type:complete